MENRRGFHGKTKPLTRHRNLCLSAEPGCVLTAGGPRMKEGSRPLHQAIKEQEDEINIYFYEAGDGGGGWTDGLWLWTRSQRMFVSIVYHFLDCDRQTKAGRTEGLSAIRLVKTQIQELCHKCIHWILTVENGLRYHFCLIFYNLFRPVVSWSCSGVACDDIKSEVRSFWWHLVVTL